MERKKKEKEEKRGKEEKKGNKSKLASVGQAMTTTKEQDGINRTVGKDER